MLFNTASYITILAAVVSWAPCQASDIYTHYTGFEGQTDPSNYMFYDPTEHCKNSTGICLTSFKYCTYASDPSMVDYDDIVQCSPNAKKDDLSWITGNTDDAVEWVESQDRPIVIYSRQANYTLKWQNHNPKYPTNVTWDTVRDASGLSFNFYTVVPAGESEFRFSFDQLANKMLPSNYLPTGNKTKEQNHNITQLVVDYMSAAGDLHFYVSQPEDPKYDKNQSLYGLKKNQTDTTSFFRLGFPQTYDLFFAQENARGYFKQENRATHKRWSIGVGVGVGLGVPLIALISFFLGKRMGRKAGAHVGKSMEMK